jgi:hypothetical protein
MQELFGRLDTALYQTVHGYRDRVTRERGAAALAPRVGMQPGTLCNKVNPSMPEHKLGLAESIMVQIAADDYSILHATNAALGHCAYRLPEHSQAGDVEILDLYAKVHEQCGLKARAIRDALRDGTVARAEVERIRTCFDDEVRAGLELLSRLEALVE